MGHDRHPGFVARHRLAFVAAVALLVPLTVLLLSTDVSLNGSFEGLYLLRGRDKPFEVRTDLFLDEEQRLIFAFPYKPVLSRLTRSQRGPGRTPPFLEFTWNAGSGDGFVVSHLDAGNLLIVNWSRFLDDQGKTPDGLFLGGSLPYPLTREADATLNDTGMAYFDGRRWYHAWCSVNELVSPAANPAGKIYPSSWEFLGSSVLSAGADHLLITSSHRVRIDGVPVQIQKWVSLRAGDLYFTMATRFENVGKAPAAYFYLYGDEPWVGNYGSSRGNVGWTRQGLAHYEGFVDTGATDFAGFYDVGNSLIGERGHFTRTASFLQWFEPGTPDLAFFTNMTHPLRPPWNTVPLSALQSRALFLQWGAQTLPPRGVKTYLLATGLVPPRPWAALPEKPAVVLDPRLLKALVPQASEKHPVTPDALPEETPILFVP